jgi:hypothetical protein
MMHSKVCWALLALACVGCSSSSAVKRSTGEAQPKGRTDDLPEEEIVPERPATDAGYPYCEEVVTPLTAKSETPLGVGGAEFLATLLDRGSGVATWLVGSGCEVEVEVDVGIDVSTEADARSLRFVESTAVYPESGPGIGIICSNYLAVDGTITLKTDDNRLDTVRPTTFLLVADDVRARRVSFTVDFDEVKLGPAFELAEFVDVAGYDEVSLWLSGAFEAGSFSGQLRGAGTFSDGVIAGATFLDLATFSAQESKGDGTERAGVGLRAEAKLIADSPAAQPSRVAPGVRAWRPLPHQRPNVGR